MEPDCKKMKSESNERNESVMNAHLECVKHILNVLALLTKNCNVFFSRTLLL